MLLEDKVAVIYGAGGAIGSAVAHAFESEGAQVFRTGRTGAGAIEQVDALDERAIDAHLQSVVDATGRVDISFNAIGLPDSDILGVPLVDLDAGRFIRPIEAYTMSYFLTARLAARRMIPNRSGVIMTVTSLPARTASRLNGGYGTAHAGKEALTRDLSMELAPHGIRVVGLRPHGLPETDTMREVYDLKADALGITWEQFQGYLAGSTHPQRVQTVDELANVAAFMASDRASGMTGTTVNLTMGSFAD